MDILILYGGNFGEKVIRNLINDAGFCKSCDPLCMHCKYGRYGYAHEIAGAFNLPNPEAMPDFIEDPDPYLPELPSADLAIATEIHPDILLHLPLRLNDAGIRGLIVPVEHSKEVSTGLANQVKDRCDTSRIESAFPKPFCSLDRKEGIIGRFISEFRIGIPSLDISVKDGAITDVTVEQSAPCGSTWFVARKLIGSVVSQQDIRDIVAEAHHSYPCTAGMEMDRELGDTILHRAGYLIRNAVEDALKRS